MSAKNIINYAHEIPAIHKNFKWRDKLYAFSMIQKTEIKGTMINCIFV